MGIQCYFVQNFLVHCSLVLITLLGEDVCPYNIIHVEYKEIIWVIGPLPRGLVYERFIEVYGRRTMVGLVGSHGDNHSQLSWRHCFLHIFV